MDDYPDATSGFASERPIEESLDSDQLVNNNLDVNRAIHNDVGTQIVAYDNIQEHATNSDAQKYDDYSLHPTMLFNRDVEFENVTRQLMCVIYTQLRNVIIDLGTEKPRSRLNQIQMQGWHI
jgi:hypothetical protein